MKLLWISISLTIFLSSQTQEHVLLYETQDSDTAEHFDCIFHAFKQETIPYCRKLNSERWYVNRSYNTCQNGAEEWTYEILWKMKISPSEVLMWSSSVEKADTYAKFYFDQNKNEDSANDSICNCTQTSTFGKYCEYQLTHEADSFENAINAQFLQKATDMFSIQRNGNILCYNTLKTCEFGLLCLDWRNICDGQQDCLKGLDEENCDILEFNECDEDEYRCRNGMCIPEEYWLDGDFDCMDWSDERAPHYDDFCVFEPTIKCEEHICDREKWSCGDGQCIGWETRMVFQTIIPQNSPCVNLRNANYMCELYPHRRLWTMPNGMCTNQIGYNDSSLSLNNHNLSDEDKCRYLIRCILSDNLEYDCPCHKMSCSQLMYEVCDEEENFYSYPNSPLIRPYIMMYYDWTRLQWSDRTPDAFVAIGSIKCRGYQGSAKKLTVIEYFWQMVRFPALDHIFCFSNIERNSTSVFQYSTSCWNDSLTFNGRPYAFRDVCPMSHRCMSQYRIGDGIYDCINDNDENIFDDQYLCKNLQNHRFRCADNKSSCLLAQNLGDKRATCKDGYDEFWYGIGQSLENIGCSGRGDPNCLFLQEYIRNSSQFDSISLANLSADTDKQIVKIPFRFYCDTHWQLKENIDEYPPYCHEWICQHDQYQCGTGQCIPIHWLCDGEWDCSDASDEEVALRIAHWSAHNNKSSKTLRERILLCHEKYSIQPFSTKCNLTDELPCFLANMTNPSDIEHSRPCIKQNQIGDGIAHCYKAWDERNTFYGYGGTMLGYSQHCHNKYVQHPFTCLDVYSPCFDAILCSWRSKNDTCSASKDVICMNGTCVPNARCNGIFDCSYGEDEYWCTHYSSYLSNEFYRFMKKGSAEHAVQFVRYFYLPQQAKKNKTGHSRTISPFHQMKYSTSITSYCNRGMAAWIGDQIKCFCSPSYYGNKCQNFSDRLTVITHVDRQNISLMLLKIKVNLLKNGKIIDHFQFYSNSTDANITKHKFYLIYSRSFHAMEHKRQRYFNRTDIITSHPYSIHFHAYSLAMNGSIEELGSWQYPINFDFLPSFRLATILRFPSWFNNITLDPCTTNNTTCNKNSVCKPVFNKNNTIYCSCKPGFYGPNCQKYESKCDSYCSLNSICKPDDRGILTNTENPFCLCSLGYFGARCYLYHDECQVNPCHNNGSCYLTFDLTGMKPFRCVCSNLFYGDQCEHDKMAVEINLTTSHIQAAVSVIQYYDVHNVTLQCLIQHQEIFVGLPTVLHYHHGKPLAPLLAILKAHQYKQDSQYFIIYIQANVSIINITSTPEHCPHALSLMPKNFPSTIPSVFGYHHICRNHTEIICFYDANYLCICEEDHSRVECFGHDPLLDHCDWCLSDGQCKRGHLQDTDNFVCLCPSCHQGHRCQFNMQAFGFTLDSLLIVDSITVKSIYVILSFLLFMFGLFTNVCSFVTFKRIRPRKFAVGNYLFIITIINELALLCLVFKFFHILVSSHGRLIGNGWCQATSYTMSVLTRSTYWLTSWITIDRLLLTLFPNGIFISNPRVAIVLSFLTLFTLLGLHFHEILFYMIIQQQDYFACVSNFNVPHVAIYNRVSTFLHYLVPFFIQIISITVLIVLITRIRNKTTEEKTAFTQLLKRQFNMQKELYITPGIIVLSACPQVILSFSLSCTQLNNFQRHILLATILLSYAPQVLGCVLYVLPSSNYRKEFQKTQIGKNLFKYLGLTKSSNHGI